MAAKTNNKIKVLCAMSGGVDSSVAAALLVQKGYDVTGAFMLNYEEPAPQAETCWIGDYQDALRVAARLHIPLIRLNFIKKYQELVLDYMYGEYEAGRTPNPDILCNKYIKFGVWLDKAKELGFDNLATGHYARLRQGKILKLMASKDKNKDQTYFLHQLNQKQLKHVLFPIGGYVKTDVRKMARQMSLPTADRAESMGICFVGEVPMKEFLMKKIKPKPGNILSTNGEILGQHDGLAFYTIGQRFGFKGQHSKAFYVIDKKIKSNELIVGHENDAALYKNEIEAGNINWISGHPPKFPLKCEVRLRHRQPLQKCVVSRARKKNPLTIKFINPQRAVTPGQFAVFYKKGECLGGGVIL